ncbi:MAG TPA: SRPBCC family protein [Allosphingosinicella sp.]|nr:SRPBCC family protein [Allosphingosinicella sp.]
MPVRRAAERSLSVGLAACVALAALAPASPAAAAVKGAAPGGFEVESSAVVAASPASVYAMLGRPGEWWAPAHTYSHDARNLTLALRAGGCFCERLPTTGGSVEHLRVVYADPGRMLRLQGGLGPLQGEGVAGSLTVTLKAVPQGTEIVMNYIVGGYLRADDANLAPIVDRVLAEQLARLAARLRRRR